MCICASSQTFTYTTILPCTFPVVLCDNYLGVLNSDRNSCFHASNGGLYLQCKHGQQHIGHGELVLDGHISLKERNSNKKTQRIVYIKGNYLCVLYQMFM